MLPAVTRQYPQLNYETIAHRLLKARLLKGANSKPPREIEHAVVAEAVGVTPSAVSQWESGEKRPSRDNVPKVAKFYGVRAAWLESGELPMEATQSVPESAETQGLDIERGKQQRRGPPPANPGDERSGGSGPRGA